MRNFLYKRLPPGAQVAQLVEQRTENPCVGGSIPPLGTTAGSLPPVYVGPRVICRRPPGRQHAPSSAVASEKLMGRARPALPIFSFGRATPPFDPLIDRDGEQGSSSGRSRSAHSYRGRIL